MYVSGLPRDITENELADTFGKVGALRKVKIYRLPSGEAKGDALVTYDLSAGDAAFGAGTLRQKCGSRRSLRPIRALPIPFAVNKVSAVPPSPADTLHDEHEAHLTFELLTGAERLLNGRDIRTGWRMSVSIAQFDKEQTATSAASSTHPASDNLVGQNSDAKTGATVDLLPRGSSLPPDEGVRRVTLLRNTFAESEAAGDANFFTDLEADIAEECNAKCGKVLVTRAILRSQLSALEALAEFTEGTIRVVFSTQQEAERCVMLMNGRLFDGALTEHKPPSLQQLIFLCLMRILNGIGVHWIVVEKLTNLLR
eukprot:SAG31_NODE_533_length_14371_cov_6.455367_2_plen_312_part_00